jgi:tetratricopeptide (TPR) repeat protein
MANDRFHSDYGVQVHRKQAIHAAVLAVVIGILISCVTVFFIGWRSRLGTEKKELLRLWENGAYEEAYRISGEKLVRKPMDYFLLTLHGFSSYQLAVAQINSFDTLTYIDDAVWSLRKALLTRRGEGESRIYYVLGKAYYYKGPSYADLAVKYLEKAREASYKARDIPEYLGLAYAAVHDYRNSVGAFTLALGSPEEEGNAEAYPSDLLLLSIARSYIELDERDTAKAYLLRCIETSKDSDMILSAKLLLGAVLAAAGDTEGAEALYLAVLDEDGDNAEAHFQLGELYALQGDTTRARARWRRAAPVHALARARLNMQ